MKILNRNPLRSRDSAARERTERKGENRIIHVLLFALFALFAVASPAARGQNAMVTSAVIAQSVTPASTTTSDTLAGLHPTYVWLNKSLASGVIGSSGWVDLTNGLAFKQHATSGGNPTQATNNLSAGAGVWFSGNSSCYLTNTGISFASGQSYTIAMVVEVINNNNTGSGSLGTASAGNNGPFMSYAGGGYIEWDKAGTLAYPIPTGGIIANDRYDIVFSASGGTITTYTNGVSTTIAVTSVPAWTMISIGGDADVDPYIGYIQKFVVWTNTALTSANASTFHTYCGSNNP
jgi:hypothetical protein